MIRRQHESLIAASLALLGGCQPVDCVETLTPLEKLLRGIPVVALVAAAVALFGSSVISRIRARPCPQWPASALAVLCVIVSAVVATPRAGGPMVLAALLLAGAAPMVPVMFGRSGVSTPRKVAAVLAATLVAISLFVVYVLGKLYVDGLGRECRPVHGMHADVRASPDDSLQ